MPRLALAMAAPVASLSVLQPLCFIITVHLSFIDVCSLEMCGEFCFLQKPEGHSGGKLWYHGQVHEICSSSLRKCHLKRLTFHILNKSGKRDRLVNSKIRTLKQNCVS